MDYQEEQYMLNQIAKMDPAIRFLDTPYERCYEVSNMLPGKPTDWVLVQHIDAATFKSSWVWREKIRG